MIKTLVRVSTFLCALILSGCCGPFSEPPEGTKSTAKKITSFSFPSLNAEITIDEESHSIAVVVPYGSAYRPQSPSITITGASIRPASGTAQNFTNPVTYTVTAEDGSTQAYTVTVTSRWYTLGQGLNGDVYAIARDGATGDLYAGGTFSTAGEVSVSNIARWDGSTWSALDAGTSGVNSCVSALVIDPATGDLYAGGTFSTAGEVSVSNIARWDVSESAWYALGTGINNWVASLAIDPATGDLYAGGYFTAAGEVSVSNIARWDGSTWSALDAGTSGDNSCVSALAIDPATGDLYAGGTFSTAGEVSVSNIARWDVSESAWYALGTGINNWVASLAIDPATGDLYAGGAFSTAGGETVSNIARWDASESVWYPLGGGLNNEVSTIAVDPVTGDLYAGGIITVTEGETLNSIGRWDGSVWHGLGDDFDNPIFSLVIDPENGSLYAGGSFPSVDGIPVNNIVW